MTTALVVGEALIDEFPDRPVVAGAPLHVAVHLAASGWNARVITRLGKDGDGDMILATLGEFGVDTTLVERSSQLPTGITSITMDGMDHSFTVLPGAWDAIQGPDPVPAAEVVYFGTLVLRDARSRSAVERIVSATDALTVVDLNLRIPDFDAERIRWAVQHADVLQLNEDELPVACDAFEVDHDPAGLHQFGPTWVCATKGPAGADLSHADGRLWSTAAPGVAVVDTVGAGDAFCAALIDGLVHRRDPRDVVEAAASSGADAASRRGGLPEPPRR